MKKKLNEIKRLYHLGKLYNNSDDYNKTRLLSLLEVNKKPSRTEIINVLTSKFENCEYLEIGIRNPDDNYRHINASIKTSVDPGLEFAENPADYKMTSNEYFKYLEKKNIERKFDVIFIDGLHKANQVYQDINNSLKYLSKNGFIVLHDCNPPTEWHARENYNFHLSPAGKAWNGTTWKAYVYARYQLNVNSCCVNSDWGLGIISKKPVFTELQKPNLNPFLDYSFLNENRDELLNLKTFEQFLIELK
ncbi:MAG: class I SAM-dependent methyltransferase [Lishizhenia sp.]